jgi:hypothetical protein
MPSRGAYSLKVLKAEDFITTSSFFITVLLITRSGASMRGSILSDHEGEQKSCLRKIQQAPRSPETFNGKVSL